MRTSSGEGSPSVGTERARVGIVVRTKDRPGMLARALDDILAQRFGDWFAIIVNDGGDAGAVGESIARIADRANGRISAIHHEHSLGRSAAANAGVRALQSEYVVLHDDDELRHPDFL